MEEASVEQVVAMEGSKKRGSCENSNDLLLAAVADCKVAKLGDSFEEPVVMNPLREPLTPINHATSSAPKSSSKSKLNFRLKSATKSAVKPEQESLSSVEADTESKNSELSIAESSAVESTILETATNDFANTTEVVTSNDLKKPAPRINVVSSGYGVTASSGYGKQSKKVTKKTNASQSSSSSSATPLVKNEKRKVPTSDVKNLTENFSDVASTINEIGEYNPNSQMKQQIEDLFRNEDHIQELLTRKIKASKFQYKERGAEYAKLQTELRGTIRESKETMKSFTSFAIKLENDLINKNEELFIKMEHVNSKNLNYQNEINHINYEKDIIENNLKLIKTNYDESIEKNKILELKLIQVNKLLEESNLMIKTMEKDINESLTECKLLNENKMILTNQLSSEKLLYKTTIEELNTSWTLKYDSEMNELNHQINEWKTQFENQTNQLKELSLTYNNLTQNFTISEDKLAEKELALVNALSQISDISKSSEILEVKLESAKAQLEGKTSELSIALSSLGGIQQASSEREAQLRETIKNCEMNLVSMTTEVSKFREDNSTLRNENSNMAKDIETFKENFVKMKEDLSNKIVESDSYRISAQELGENLAIEKELRCRAESRETEERRERTAACAQLIAQTQAQQAAISEIRNEFATNQTKLDFKIQELNEELLKSQEQVKEANERVVSAQAETCQFRSMLEHERSNTEELVDMARQSGEMEALKHRLQEKETDHGKFLSEAKLKIAELEEEVRLGEATRRKMHNTIQELRGNVRVYARVRPFLPGDGVQEEDNAVSTVSVRVDKQSLTISNLKNEPDVHSFTFDKAFAPCVGQEAVFDEVSEYVQSALDGYQVCLFSYGQTGSGKTHTMQGSRTGPMKGIIPRAIEQVSKYKTYLETQGWEFSMDVTFIEIYNELIRDLLRNAETVLSLPSSSSSSSSSTALDIRVLKDGQVGVPGVTRVEVDPSDEETIGKIMDLASRHRAVAETDMNAESSRSHSIFTLHLKGVNKQLGTTISGALNLADLAGSERLDRSGATGDRMKETQAINKSLSCLTDVFMAISNKNNHIPFRNSKLTHLLSPCLSGDGKTLMMVNLSPTETSYFETLCSLRFAKTVKHIIESI